VSGVWLFCSSHRQRLNGQVPAAASSTDTHFAWKVVPVSFIFYFYGKQQYKGITQVTSSIHKGRNTWHSSEQYFLHKH
jgi:hypothetical protein